MPTAYVLLNSDLGSDVSIITEIKEFSNFYYAEELHQNYFNRSYSIKSDKL